MKKILYLLLNIMVTFSACANSGDNWRSKVGLSEDCTNPVFTRPFRMNSSSRVEGAGICMNDGEAYTNRGCDFSSEWHYEPKLPLCEEEMAALPRVMGLYFNEVTNPRVLEPLKFCVVAHHGCGAVVVYRAFDNYRYTNIRSDNLEQFIAVYDEKGNLTDAMMMGYGGDFKDIMSIEPHKDYEGVMSDTHRMEFDKTGEHFSITRYSYLKGEGQGVPGKVEMKRYYTITPEGKIILNKITNNSEGYSGDKVLKPGAPIGDVANVDAMNMLELICTPMSAPDMYSKLDKTCALLLENKVVRERLMHIGMMIYNRDPQAFLTYAYDNRAKTSLIKLLKLAKTYAGPGCEYGDCLAETINKFSPSENAKEWFKRQGLVTVQD